MSAEAAAPSFAAAGCNDRSMAPDAGSRPHTPLIPFTYFHVLLSLAGIFTGFVAVSGMISGKAFGGWIAAFLATTVATSVTGFLFPFHEFLPSHGVGIVSLVALALAVYALYAARLAGAWRRIFVVTAVMALYLNVFVFIVQAFMKVPALKAIAPRQNEPPFVVAQVVNLALFVALAVAAARNFRAPSGGAGGAPSVAADK